jgi:hypothetical protein
MAKVLVTRSANEIDRGACRSAQRSCGPGLALARASPSRSCVSRASCTWTRQTHSPLRSSRTVRQRGIWTYLRPAPHHVRNEAVAAVRQLAA